MPTCFVLVDCPIIVNICTEKKNRYKEIGISLYYMANADYLKQKKEKQKTVDRSI